MLACQFRGATVSLGSIPSKNDSICKVLVADLYVGYHGMDLWYMTCAPSCDGSNGKFPKT